MSLAERVKKCPFCDYAGPSKILASSATSFVIEPLEPCVEGHLLVIPKKHITHLWEDLETSAELMKDVCSTILSKGYNGRCNVIVNDGRDAGQTVMHVHVHLVPRKKGDGVKMPWSYQGKGYKKSTQVR